MPTNNPTPRPPARHHVTAALAVTMLVGVFALTAFAAASAGLEWLVPLLGVACVLVGGAVVSESSGARS